MPQRQFLALVRHGHSEANAALVEAAADALYYSVAGGDHKVDLTAIGEREGTASGVIMRELLTSDDEPFTRCTPPDSGAYAAMHA